MPVPDSYRTVSFTSHITGSPQIPVQLARPSRASLLSLHPADRLRTAARVPAERQADGLAHCFRPLFKDEGPRRDQLEPLANLNTWIEKSVRLDPRSQDAKVLLPDLAEHVAAIDTEKGASILMLSTLFNHAPSDRDATGKDKPILARSWMAVEGKNTCKYARPGVIVLGPGQGERLQVCIEKKRCTKHWAQPKPATTAPSSEDQAGIDEARRAQEDKHARERQAAERWQNELRPRALKLIAPAPPNCAGHQSSSIWYSTRSPQATSFVSCSLHWTSSLQPAIRRLPFFRSPCVQAGGARTCSSF
jgi:hypothetical protein